MLNIGLESLEGTSYLTVPVPQLRLEVTETLSVQRLPPRNRVLLGLSHGISVPCFGQAALSDPPHAVAAALKPNTKSLTGEQPVWPALWSTHDPAV